MTFFVHPQGLCESEQVGPGTRVWAFAHVLPGARIGRDVNICDGVFVENDVVIGDRVTIKCGVQVWDGVTLEDDVFVGPNVTFTNDPFPRSKQWQDSVARTRVAAGASLGGGSVILPGLVIGREAMVGAGSVVTHDVPAHAIVAGNPARIIGYVQTQAPATDAAGSAPAPQPGAVPDLVRRASDLRGSLLATEFTHLPFTPRRFFTVYGVPSRDVRGQHAHRRCEQFLVCLAGQVTCLLDDGSERRVVTLAQPGDSLYMPAMTWGAQYHYSSDAVLGVLASLPYDPDDYIHDYETFRQELARTRA